MYLKMESTEEEKKGRVHRFYKSSTRIGKVRCLKIAPRARCHLLAECQRPWANQLPRSNPTHSRRPFAVTDHLRRVRRGLTPSPSAVLSLLSPGKLPAHRRRALRNDRGSGVRAVPRHPAHRQGTEEDMCARTFPFSSCSAS